MTIALSVLAFGLCFALLGVLQLRRPGCTGNCGACTRGCTADHGREDT
jgi:hypothetical protein